MNNRRSILADNKTDVAHCKDYDVVTASREELLDVFEKSAPDAVMLSADSLRYIMSEQTKDALNLQNTILRTIAELVEFRDDISGGHIERTQAYIKILAEALLTDEVFAEEASSWDLSLLLGAAQLHDVGKIAISDSILQKPGKLTPEEFNEMKTHTTFGVNVIRQIEIGTGPSAFLRYAADFAGNHHEKWDGSGYPAGLSGEEIPLLGRLMAIVDVYDALTNERPYKKAFPHDKAVKVIADSSGTHFDPRLIDVFLANEDKIFCFANG